MFSFLLVEQMLFFLSLSLSLSDFCHTFIFFFLFHGCFFSCFGFLCHFLFVLFFLLSFDSCIWFILDARNVGSVSYLVDREQPWVYLFGGSVQKPLSLIHSVFRIKKWKNLTCLRVYKNFCQSLSRPEWALSALVHSLFIFIFVDSLNHHRTFASKQML